MEAKKIRECLKKIYRKIKNTEDFSEEDLRIAFVDSGIFKELGYKLLKDIRFERDVKGKRSDLLAFDDYKNIIFVIEFKREIKLEEDFNQLWERYVKPLKAKYGILADGEKLFVYERINSNWELKEEFKIKEVTLAQCEKLYSWLKKPEIERTKVDEVLKYFEKFDKPEEKINLKSEIAQKHFFDSFELRENTIFANLVQRTIELFDSEFENQRFLKSAYSFWKISFAKKPEKIPENWKKIMKSMNLKIDDENLFKFMFCLESAYSLFTRLILAKACEDYKLPYVDFSEFIKTEIKHKSFRGDISLLAWGITVRDLIDNMKQRLVKSVFEGDIFYWWEDCYKGLERELYTPKPDKPKVRFGEALAEIILTLYKFDFSEIVGDPLGTLYQRYFDKETRKALGEFYTPIEVVEYILDAVGYKGKAILNKRLLDPACGSGTFLVEALKRYLKVAEEEAEERGWDEILKRICNKFQIVGFDIHPFATFLAQMQLMLVMIPVYKRAIEQNPMFVLSRLPIFRTDSLADEVREGMVTLKDFENGVRDLEIDTMLKLNDEETLKIRIPSKTVAISDKTGLLNVEEYFVALQAIFDVVKEAVDKGEEEVSRKNLNLKFKLYLQDKEWDKLVEFFLPYANHLLEKFKELMKIFGDGKLIKSVEDVALASILKGYVKYDFVVGNPPYVRQEKIKAQKEKFSKLYPDVYDGRADIYVYFFRRGLEWLNQDGSLGYISNNMFIRRGYGKKLRNFISKNYNIKILIDFGDSGVFKDVTNYPCIIIIDKKIPEFAYYAEIIHKPRELTNKDILNIIKSTTEKKKEKEFTGFSIFRVKPPNSDEWKFLPDTRIKLIKKIELSSTDKLGNLTEEISMGQQSNADKVHIVSHSTVEKYNLEKELLKPLVRGEGVKKWRVKWNKEFLIFPYKRINNKDKVIPRNELAKNYPNTWRYFNLKENKTLLEKRHYLMEKIRDGTRQEFYELWIPKKSIYFDNPKIMTPDISNTNNFAYDEKGFYAPTTVFIIILRSDIKSRRNYLYFLGLLNSRILEFYFKHISPFMRGKYFRYNESYLKRLPIKLPETPEEKELASQIVEKVDLILEKAKLEQKVQKFPDEYIKEYRERGEEFDLITITFNSGHKEIKPIVKENSEEGGYNIIIKKEKPIFVDSEIKAEFVKSALKGKKVGKNEKIQLLLPKSDFITKEIIEEWKKDKKKIKEEPTISTLENEINELVYRLYNLNDEDKKIIEEFLSKF